MLLLLITIATAGIPQGGARGTWDRPALSGPELLLDSEDGFFRIHYTEEGADTVNLRDEDGNGVPDYAERVLGALQLARESYTEAGWRPVVGDMGLGGSNALDVYLRSVNINGYAYALEGEAAEGGYACFIEVDPALITAGLVLESVVVHEVHHCVEYRYGLTSSWIHEGSATAEQYTLVTDLGLQLALSVLWDLRLSNPQLPVDDRTGNYEYAAFSFFKYWEDDIAQRSAFWESLADQDSTEWREHVEAASIDQGLSGFDEAFLGFQADMAFACGLDDGRHWEEGPLQCTTTAAMPVESLAAGTTELSSTHATGAYTTTAHSLPAGGSTDALQVQCTAPGDIGLALLAVDAEGTLTESELALGPSAALARPLTTDGAVTILVANLDNEGLDASCTLTRIEPTEWPDTGEEPAATCGCTQTGPGSLWILLPLWLRRRAQPV